MMTRRTGNIQEAIVDYDKAISLKPDFARAYAKKGCTIVKLERYGEAIDWINKGLKLDPNLQFAKDCKTEALSKL